MTSGLSGEQKKQLSIPLREGMNRLIAEYEAKKTGETNEFKRGVIPDHLLLQQCADALRHIRLNSANWDEYPMAKKSLTDLIAAGY